MNPLYIAKIVILKRSNAIDSICRWSKWILLIHSLVECDLCVCVCAQKSEKFFSSIWCQKFKTNCLVFYLTKHFAYLLLGNSEVYCIPIHVQPWTYDICQIMHGGSLHINHFQIQHNCAESCAHFKGERSWIYQQPLSAVGMTEHARFNYRRSKDA